MYSFIFTDKNTQNNRDEYLLHIIFDSEIIESTFVSFQAGTSMDDLDLFANNKIDLIEGF